jgi:hypothetical protein
MRGVSAPSAQSPSKSQMWASQSSSATVRDRLPQVAELKTKLAVAERVLGTLETEPQSRRERAGQHDLTRGPPPREEVREEGRPQELRTSSADFLLKTYNW